MKKGKTLLTLCFIALALTSCSGKKSETTTTTAPTVQSTEGVENTDTAQKKEADTTIAPTQEPENSEEKYDDTLEGIEKYFSDKGLLSGDRIKKEASMIGGIDGFAYKEADIEIYEYDVDSEEYKTLSSGESVPIKGMESYSITADAVNGKFVLLSDNKKIIKAFNDFNN